MSDNKKILSIHHNGLHIELEFPADAPARLLHFSPRPFDADTLPDEQRTNRWLVQVHATGANPRALHANKHVGTSPAAGLRYVTHRDTTDQRGRLIEIEQAGATDPAGEPVTVITHWHFLGEAPVVRAWTEVRNTGTAPLGLEYVSSFALVGLTDPRGGHWDQTARLWLGHHGWCAEGQWRQYRLPELGLSPFVPGNTKRISVASTGTWPASEHLPMGILEDVHANTHLFWQIETNGSWHWELSDAGEPLYLQLAGPTEAENHWWKNLQPGEAFVSVPVAVGAGAADIDETAASLTRYRRSMRRSSEDTRKLPVIFNDYMNCLWGDPTTEKLLPLIDAAAEAGCGYFCIDAGWYADGFWWDGVGQWLPSDKRFPKGITEPLDYIRSKGMTPGLWLELEVMGVECPLAKEAPDEWFFRRHGRRVIDNCRYQLDYRHPDVIAHADAVIDRLVKDYGVGYIKMDYNINAGPGTEVDADSFGDGLLQHNRAYRAWIERVMQRYPDLVIENCGSGGLRETYGLLDLHSIQSTSDQTDYRRTALIAAACPLALAPEQAAVWSYPLKDGDEEEVIFNMVNSMLLRIHQSGHLAELSAERLALVTEGIRCYESIRKDIPDAMPFWPLGLPKYGDGWTSLGMAAPNGTIYVAVWRLDGPHDTCALPIRRLAGQNVTLSGLYPAKADGHAFWNDVQLTVQLPKPFTARLYKLQSN